MFYENLDWDDIWLAQVIDKSTYVAILSSIDTESIRILQTINL